MRVIELHIHRATLKALFNPKIPDKIFVSGSPPLTP